MCGTKKDPNSQVCKNCGYIFEDFSSGISAPLGSGYPAKEEQQPFSFDTFPTPSASSASMESALFTASRPLASSIAQGLIYAVIALFFVGGIGLSIYSIFVIAFFVLIGVVPALFSARKYEFYDDSLLIHKIVGGDRKIQYSDLQIYNYPVRGKLRVALIAEGQRRPIVIPGNPENSALGLNLSQFLTKKLKVYAPESREEHESIPLRGVNQEPDTDEYSDSTHQT